MAFPNDWSYSEKKVIHGSLDGELSNQIMPVITIPYQSGMNNDFSDVRFADSDRATLLDYRLIRKIDGDFAEYSVEIPSIPSYPFDKNIYVYYGNSSAIDESNPNLNFFYFYDFKYLYEWTNTGVTVTDGIVDIPNNGDISKDISHISGPFIVETRYKQVSSYRNRLYLTTSPTESSPTGFDFGIFSGQIFWGNYTGITINNDVWHRIQFKNTASDYIFKVLNDSKSSTIYTGNKGSHINDLDTLSFHSTESVNSHFKLDWVILSETETSFTTTPPIWATTYEITDQIKAILKINDENYNDWLWQNIIEVIGSVDGQLTNYPINITVPYVPEFMNYNFSDIRFGTDYGLNLSYFLRRKVDGDFAEFIVNIPVIPASPETTTIYLYAGNDNAVDRSDGLKTFEFFDHFDEGLTPELDTNKWDFTSRFGQGSANIEESVLRLQINPVVEWAQLVSKATFGQNYIAGCRVKYSDLTVGEDKISFGFDDGNTRYIKEKSDGTTTNFLVNNAGIEDTGEDHKGDYDHNEFNVFEFQNKVVGGIKENINFEEEDSSLININTPIPIEFYVFCFYNTRYIDIDYIYVRKSIDNEPYIGELGTWATTQHTTIYPATLEIPYWEDIQALLCIRPLRADFKALLNITGSDEELIQALLTINEDKSNNYINLYQALLTINANANNKDVKATLSIGNVLSGSMEAHGKILYNYNQNPLEEDKNDNKNVQFVMNLGGRIYG